MFVDSSNHGYSGGFIEAFTLDSFIRGYHAYMHIWTPFRDEMLRLIPEPTNSVDRRAVAVMKEDQIVGHVSFNLVTIVSQFLQRDVNKAFAKVTGASVNRGDHVLTNFMVHRHI